MTEIKAKGKWQPYSPCLCTLSNGKLFCSNNAEISGIHVIVICLKNSVTTAVYFCSSVLPTFTCLPFYSTYVFLHQYKRRNPSSPLIYSLGGCS